MRKDDYHVLAYQLLSYLYGCLKAGERPETRCVVWCDGDERTKINERYWNYILVHLRDAGYIEGLSFKRVIGCVRTAPFVTPLLNITPQGIGYLEDDRMMQKAQRFIKGLVDEISVA